MKEIKSLKSLHEYMHQLRKLEDEWKKTHPFSHPVEMAKEMAQTAVEMAKEDELIEIGLHPAVYNGGVVEYNYAIAYLEEAGIRVRELSDSRPVDPIQIGD